MTFDIVMRSPEHAAALLPHLLGFVPSESLIAIWVRDDAVILTQRLDLPKSPQAHEAVITAFVAAGRHATAQSVVLCIVSDEIESFTPLALAMADAIAESGVNVLDALEVSPDHYRSLLCHEPCCPPEGSEISGQLRHEVAASFAVTGTQVLASRDELVASWARDLDQAAAFEGRVVGIEQELELVLADPGEVEPWRDRTAPIVMGWLAGDRDLTHDELARLVVWIADVRVRDMALWSIARLDDARAALHLLRAAVRLAPDGYVAPVATCAAMTAWFTGDGARAGCALKRALNDDPDYSLATLLDRAVHAGLEPTLWRDCLRDLPMESMRMPDIAA